MTGRWPALAGLAVLAAVAGTITWVAANDSPGWDMLDRSAPGVAEMEASIATMVERLREQPGARGLITANGGYLTKHAMGIYSAEPPAQPFRHANPQAEVDARPRRELDESVDGPVEVESAVVTFDRGGAPSHALVACLTPEGRRAWGATTDPDAMARFTTVETAGDPGTLDPAGAFHFT